MKLVIDIPEEEYNECKMQVEMMKQEGFLIESLNTALRIFIANGTPLPNITDIVHKTIYSFFDIADDNSEEPINEKDELLLAVNKAICNNIKGVLKDADSN